jgi:hypothetical protein
MIRVALRSGDGGDSTPFSGPPRRRGRFAPGKLVPGTREGCSTQPRRGVPPSPVGCVYAKRDAPGSRNRVGGVSSGSTDPTLSPAACLGRRRLTITRSGDSRTGPNEQHLACCPSQRAVTMRTTRRPGGERRVVSRQKVAVEKDQRVCDGCGLGDRWWRQWSQWSQPEHLDGPTGLRSSSRGRSLKPQSLSLWALR